MVGASSVSISRWEREHDRVRTLINVGELGPGEERFPTGETYELADYPLAARLLRDGESYVVSRGDDGLGPADRQLLDALDKGSYIGVPVIFDGRTWGKLEAFANVGAVPVHAPPRPVPGGDRRPGRRGDRARRAVLARQRARLRRPAHRPRQPARARRAARGGGRARRPARDRLLRPRRPQADQRRARATRRATARSGAPPTRSPPPAKGGPARRSTASAATSSASCSRAATPRARPRSPPTRRRAGATAPSRCRSPAAPPRCGPAPAPADLFRAADAAQYTPSATGAARRRGRRRPAAGRAGVDRRAHRDRSCAETRALAEQLLADAGGAARRRARRPPGPRAAPRRLSATRPGPARA